MIHSPTQPDMQLWIGTVGERIMLFDKSVQIEGGPHVLLWNYLEREMKRYDPKVARKQSKRVYDPDLQSKVITAYKYWLDGVGVVWLKEEAAYVKERLDAERREQAQRSAMLQERKRQLDIKEGRIRSAHCYLCKSELDSQRNEYCSMCNWLKCNCGACGCKYD